MDAKTRRHDGTPELEVTPAGDEDFYAGISGEITHGGVFLPIADPPPPGTEVRVAITLPGVGMVHCLGRVRWVRLPDAVGADGRPGCDVAWQTDDPRSRGAVRRFLAARNAAQRALRKAS